MAKVTAPIHRRKVEWFPSRNFNTKLNSKEEIPVTKNNVNHEKSFISLSSIALNLYYMLMAKFAYQLNQHFFIFFYGDTLSISHDIKTNYKNPAIQVFVIKKPPKR